MKARKILFALLFVIMGGMMFSAPSGATMVKEVAMGVFTNAPNQTELDRFYLRYHGPEVVKFSGPWLRRYQLWLPYDPPEEAVERFNAVKGRYAELWFGSEEDYLDRPAHGPMSSATFESVGENKQTAVMVNAKPTEEFYDPDPNPEQTTIYRWVQIIRYPDGVSVEDGEKWFLEVHAKEALNQPGLLKFVSHKILVELGEKMGELMMKSMKMPSSGGGAPAAGGPGGGAPGGPAPSGEGPQGGGPGSEGPQGGGAPAMGNMSQKKTWVRVNEYWYKDEAAWRKAVLESPPEYTAPPWGGTYPYVEMMSTFLPYMHDVDFLKGGYIVP